MSSTENLAASHEILAQKIETDVENPLRQFASSNREMKALNSSQSNISSVAQDLSNAQKKAAKGGRKAEQATGSIDEASRQWESQAPYVFEQLQALDERRVNNLRDVLTQFQTHEVDQVERSRASAESCLNALLSLETADEIRTFAARVGEGQGRGLALPVRERSSTTNSSLRPATASAQTPPAPPPPRLTQDRSARRMSSHDGASSTQDTPQKGKLGGLRRLGTVINKRKSVAPPPPPTEKKEKKSRFPFRRGDSSRSFQDLEETGADLSRGTSNEPQRPSSQIQPQLTGMSSRHQAPQPIPEETSPMVNGTSNNPFMSQRLEEAAPPPGPPPRHSTGLMEPMTPQQKTIATPLPTEPTPTPASPEQFQPPTGPPPQQADFTPRAQPEAPSIASTDADDSARAFAIRDKPIQEDASEAQLAMSNMANQLRLSGVQRVGGSVRGRRDVRNTMFFPAGVDTSPAVNLNSAGTPTQSAASPGSTTSPGASDIASPIARVPATQRTIHEESALSDTHSIHSAHSLSTLPHHPDLHSPGLNASIVETVNTWFSESGVTKSFVTGDIALAYNATTTSAPAESETVRLTRFELLEKVATNPMFVSVPKPTSPNATAVGQRAEEQAGTYTVALNSIRRATPSVALKYQLHVDESNLAQYSPLLLTPAWQILEGQTSVILLYSLNPTFSTGAEEGLTLKNVIISVSLDPSSETKAQSAMMAPTNHASFRKRTGAVTWKIPDLTIPTGGKQERMLVRFLTPGGMAKRGGIEVKFEVQGRAGSVVGVERKVAEGGREVDPFADEGRVSGEGDGEGVKEKERAWEDVETRRVLVSGRYCAT